MTTRGLGETEMELLADWIDRAVTAAGRADETELEQIRGEVRELALAFPPPA